MNFKNLSAAFFVVLLMVVAAPKTASAGPIYTFSVSTGIQPSNVGTITLTQVDGDTVNVKVDLLDATYGFMNSGGKHTPFAFTLAGSETGVSAEFLQPSGGGPFSFSLLGGEATPFGIYGIAINSSAGNGSGDAYYGDLEFLLTRTSGLSTEDFIANTKDPGYFFAADLTDGKDTGSQGWSERTTCTVDCGQDRDVSAVPEPASMLLLGTGLLAVARARRKKTS